MKLMKRKSVLSLLIAAMAFTGCKEYIEDSTRYTFTGHTVASFLEAHEDVYGSFIYILERGGRLNLMKAYGQYTCFAPTNDAVARFLFEQDSIYRASLVDDNPNDVVWTGVTSPELTELSDSMCKVIAQTHLVPGVYMSIKMEGDIIPTMNMNDRYLGLSYDVDEDGFSVMIINGNSKIISKDEEVENGVVHTVDAVLNPSTNTLPAQIEEHSYFHIMSEAIEITGYADMMQNYKDESYMDGDKTASNIGANGQVPYPANRYYGYCAFLEPDSVFWANGIYNVNDLKERCREWYPKADASAPLTSPENPLNQFVGYHLMDRKVPYSRLVMYNLVLPCGYSSEKDFYDYSDRKEYYETMSGRLLNVTMPRSLVEDAVMRKTIYLNFYNEPNSPVEDIINVKVYSGDEFRDLNTLYSDFSSDALNGTIHPIDKILIYDEDVMAGRVLNTIVRIDFASMLPELTNNNIRWNHFAHTGQGEIFIPHTYCKNLKVNTSETRHYILDPHVGWGNYQGDEMMSQDSYDIAYKLPPMPAGTYEIRLGYTAYYLRGIAQFYLDDEVTGIPVDLRLTTDNPKIGFVVDSSTDDNGIQNDKEMKNRGYLKGPNTMHDYGEWGNARDNNQIIRTVITTKYLSEGDHWLRFKNVYENSTATTQFMHDYVEFVPVSYIRDESIPLEEKRK